MQLSVNTEHGPIRRRIIGRIGGELGTPYYIPSDRKLRGGTRIGSILRTISDRVSTSVIDSALPTVRGDARGETVDPIKRESPRAGQTKTVHARDAQQIASSIIDVIVGQTHASLDREPVVLLTHVSVTDLCHPEAERNGTLFLFLSRVQDAIFAAPRRNHNRPETTRELETAWMNLTRLCGLSVVGTGANPICLSLVSLACVAAAGAAHYRERQGIDTLSAFVVANYRDRDIRAKLRLFDELLVALISARIFPHSVLTVAGGLVKATESDRVACVTLLQRGCHEIADSHNLAALTPAVFRVPACLFLDMDEDHAGAKAVRSTEGAMYFVYLLWIYSQDPGRHGYELYVMKTVLQEDCVRDMLSSRFMRRRINNTIGGYATAARPAPQKDQYGAFDIIGAADAARNDVNREHSRHPLEKPLAGDKRLLALDIDTSGTPTYDTALYAAYCLIGVAGGDQGGPTFITERSAGVDLRVALIPGMTYRDGVWRSCW